MRGLIELGPRELRVLGALMEKEQTTPEYYPMTLKGLVGACNQKTNREPVMSLGEVETLNVLRVLLQENLVERIAGARADRWGHRVDELLGFKKNWKALATLLILRGPQTLGELRSRADRMHPFADLQEVESVLRQLAATDPPFSVELPRRPGQKETRWAVNLPGIVDSIELEASFIASPTMPDDSVAERLSTLEAAVSRLEQEVRELRSQIIPPSVAD